MVTGLQKPYDESIMLTAEHEDEVTDSIHRYFTNSVVKRLMTDVPFGILLSGGLDSSLVASVAQKVLYLKVVNLVIYTHLVLV